MSNTLLLSKRTIAKKTGFGLFGFLIIAPMLYATTANAALWYVYKNCVEGLPCTIGVAKGGYATAYNARGKEGWVMDSIAHQNARQAWITACRKHWGSPSVYNAPDIDNLTITCSTICGGNPTCQASSFSGGGSGLSPIGGPASRSRSGGRSRAASTLANGSWLYDARCPSGKYPGALSFAPSRSGLSSFIGKFLPYGGGGSMWSGRLSGRQISFVRRIAGRVQTWRGALSSDGRSISNGVITQNPPHESCTFTARKK